MPKKIKPIKAWAVIDTTLPEFPTIPTSVSFDQLAIFSSKGWAEQWDKQARDFLSPAVRIVPVLISPIKPAKRALT